MMRMESVHLNASEHCLNRIYPGAAPGPCIRAYVSVSLCLPRSLLVFMHAAGVRAFKRIWRIAGIATFSSPCVCDTVIQAVCFPSAIKSNRPSSPSEAHSKTTAVIDRCRGRCVHTQMHKTTTQIYLSQRGKTARLWVRSRLGLHYAFKRVYAHEH